MTDAEFLKFAAKMTDLFPTMWAKLTTTQVGRWRKAMDLFPAHVPGIVADEMYESDLKAYEITLGKLKSRCQLKCADMRAGSGVPESPDLIWVQRQQWIATADAEKTAELEGMSDDEIELLMRAMLYRRARDTSGSMVRLCQCYWQWQAVAYRIGRRESWPESLPEEIQGYHPAMPDRWFLECRDDALAAGMADEIRI